MTKIAEWTAAVRAEIKELAVPESHVPTANERNNVVHLCFMQIFGHTNRAADLAIVEMMCPNIKDMADLRERYVPALANLIWDHWMGEPAECSEEEVKDLCLAFTDLIFTMDAEVRNDIEPTAD